jgi:hypothetical protein
VARGPPSRSATKTLNPIAVATNKPRRNPAGLGFSLQDGFQSTLTIHMTFLIILGPALFGSFLLGSSCFWRLPCEENNPEETESYKFNR